MFGRRKKNQTYHPIDTLIGANTQITGDISFSGGLRIDGHVVGDVTATDEECSTLVLSNEGSIKGNIRAANVVLNGAVIGSIEAYDYLDLHEHAKVIGDVRYGSLEIQLGASVEGKMIHQRKSDGDHAKSPEKMLPFIVSASDRSSAPEEKT
ncbi:MAG: polymer-forming cytoskeletal protein [Nitrosomonas sp.]|nr:MAG: polymer-forming cytoskeletal protein [Nitrosomonas sp.]